MNKKPWFSKTLWINVLLAVFAIAAPSVSTWISGNMESVSLIFVGINMILRFASKEKLSLTE